MSYTAVFAALLIALLLTFIFSGSYRHRGPFRGLLIFFLILFLAAWSSQIWINPIGPLGWGVSWVPLIFVSLFVSLILVAAAGPVDRKTSNAEIDSSIAAVGAFFWFLILILLIAVVAGYFYLLPPLVKP
jgi:hypothetical protein